MLVAPSRLQRVKWWFRERYDAVAALPETFGGRFLLFVMMVEHGVKGFLCGGGAGGVVGLPILFMFRSYEGAAKMTASQIQVLKTIAVTPWSLKSIFGVIADLVYVSGYNKLPYIAGTLYFSLLACLILGVLWPLPPTAVTLLLFCIFLNVAVTDLLTEAKYSEKIALNSKHGPSLISFVWGGIYVGQGFSIWLSGFLLERVSPHTLYLIPVLPLALLAIPLYYNWLGDEPRYNRADTTVGDESDDQPVLQSNLRNCGCGSFSLITASEEGDEDGPPPLPSSSHLPWSTASGGERSAVKRQRPVSVHYQEEMTPTFGFDMAKLKRERQAFILAAIIGAISITTSILGLCRVRSSILFGVSFAGAFVMIGAFFRLADPVIARIQTFVIVQNMCSISIEAASFFFFTDDAAQYPEGPHFSISFYVTVMGLVGAGCAAIGTFSYKMLMSEWTYRSVFLFNNVIFMLATLTNVVVYKRWNVVIGCPDEVFVLGTEAFQVILAMWTYIPATLLISQLCPPGLEATMFAILAGSSNLGASLAQYQGVFVLELFGVNPSGATGESAQFTLLWLASLTASVAAIVPCFLIPCLIPDLRQTEPVLAVHREREDRETYLIEDSDLSVKLSSDEDGTVEL
jgi:hypothetical protein